MYKKTIYTTGFFLVIILLFINIGNYISQRNFEKKYDAGDFSAAETFLNQEDRNDTVLHNLGNTVYKQYFQQEEGSIELLETALVYYSGSLSIKENEDTRFNYNIVKNILDRIQEDEKNQEAESQEKQEQEGSDGEEGTESSENTSGTGSTGENQEQSGSKGEEQNSGISQNARGEEYKLGENDKIQEMTKAEEQALEQAIDQIQKEQIYNQQFFGKQEQASDFQKAFDTLMNGGGEKDW